jgi:hypothetical protein
VHALVLFDVGLNSQFPAQAQDFVQSERETASERA